MLTQYPRREIKFDNKNWSEHVMCVIFSKRQPTETRNNTAPLLNYLTVFSTGRFSATTGLVL